MTVIVALGSAIVACVTEMLRIREDFAVALILGISFSLW